MSGEDKLKNTTEKVTGKIKETVGDATDDRSMEAEGKREQSAADLKNAGEKIKDAFRPSP
jgi:uncharacterized protein YjbJ (UPF0337 family)